jgi:NAD+ synthase (glutamine-hydrolysing)
MNDLRAVVKDEHFVPKSYQDIVGRILVTSYLGTKNSSSDTLKRAKSVANGIGSLHYELDIDSAYESIIGIF